MGFEPSRRRKAAPTGVIQPGSFGEQGRNLRVRKTASIRLSPSDVGSAYFLRDDLRHSGLLLEESGIVKTEDATFHQAMDGVVLFGVQIDTVGLAKFGEHY